MDDKILLDEYPILVISKSILDKMIEESNKSNVEIGGVLIGYKLTGIDEYRITDITFPFDNDVSLTTYFDRKSLEHNRVLNRLHKEDMSKTYLGDWHSHPASSSTPSNLDKSTYNNHTLNSRTSSHHLFYVIIGADIDIQVHSYMTKKHLKTAKFRYEVI